MTMTEMTNVAGMNGSRQEDPADAERGDLALLAHPHGRTRPDAATARLRCRPT